MTPILTMLLQIALENVRSLWPRIEYVPNPVEEIRGLTRKQWGFFLFGFFVWSLDAFDFHAVTITNKALQAEFNQSPIQLSLALTFSMMGRPVGAAIFGAAADTWGRKWPFVCACALLFVFELATGLCQTWGQFLAFRAFFGVAMGGLYGNAATTALEDAPKKSRGILSGVFQSGYPFGYMLAAAFWKAFEPTQVETKSWRTLFIFAACPPIIFTLIRLFMDETETYKRRRSLIRTQNNSIRTISDSMKVAWQISWRIFIYLAVLLTVFTLMSHTSQDLYPLMLQNKGKDYDFDDSTVELVMIVANLGGMLGSSLAGYWSQVLGRRFVIILLCIIGSALVYPYTYVQVGNGGIFAAVFFEQFCVQGAFGIIPIHLIELSPAPFRTLIVGASYHMGILFGSPTNSIVAAAVEDDGSSYHFVICVFMFVIFLFIILVSSVGPERRGADLVEDGWDEGFESQDLDPPFSENRYEWADRVVSP